MSFTAKRAQVMYWADKASSLGEIVKVRVVADDVKGERGAYKDARSIVGAFCSLRQSEKIKVQRRLGKDTVPQFPYEDVHCQLDRVDGSDDYIVEFVPQHLLNARLIVEITTPDGKTYIEGAFDQMKPFGPVTVHEEPAIVPKYDPLENIPLDVDPFTGLPLDENNT